LDLEVRYDINGRLLHRAYIFRNCNYGALKMEERSLKGVLGYNVVIPIGVL